MASRLFMRGRHAVHARPAEAILRAAARAIFGADPTPIAEFVHRFEYGGVIDLPLVRLMTRRHRRTLQMANHRKKFLETMDQVTADDLHVIEIELHADIWLADLCDNSGRVLHMIEKIIRPVATVNRLYEQVYVPCRRTVGGDGKVFNEHPVGCRTLLRRDLARKAMNRAGANLARIIERAVEQRLPILLAPRHGGESEFAFATGRCIQAQNGELVFLYRGLHRSRGHVVRKLQLDGLEAGGCGRINPFEQWPFGEQIAEIGGKARHGLPLNDPLRADARAYSLAPRTAQCHPEKSMNANTAFHIAVLPGDG